MVIGFGLLHLRCIEIIRIEMMKKRTNSKPRGMIELDERVA